MERAESGKLKVERSRQTSRVGKMAKKLMPTSSTHKATLASEGVFMLPAQRSMEHISMFIKASGAPSTKMRK